MDIDKANKTLVPYMMHLLEKITYKKYNYNLDMASDALKHAEYMAESDKTSKTPEHLLYCYENTSSIKVPSRYLKLGIFNIVNNWFRYSQTKDKILNASEIGIGVALKENEDNSTTIFVAQRMR